MSGNGRGMERVRGFIDEWNPFLVSTLINKECFAKTLIDTGCLSYGMIDSRFATCHNLQRFSISPVQMVTFEADSKDQISEVAVAHIDIDGHVEKRIFFYIAPRLADYDLILGMPWVTKNDARINVPKDECLIAATATTVKNQTDVLELTPDYIAVSAVAFQRLTRGKLRKTVQVFGASLRDIEKALSTKKKQDPRTKLPEYLHDFL